MVLFSHLLQVLLVLLLLFAHMSSARAKKGSGPAKKSKKSLRSLKSKQGSRQMSRVLESEVVAKPEVQVEKQVSVLRMKGRQFLAKKDFSKAAYCYAGILQLNEGKGGKEAGVLRRRCSLTLAECEIKVGQLEQAISLCSEVIDEASIKLEVSRKGPNGSEEESKEAEEKELQEALGKAYYRRGVSLMRMNLMELAMLDLQAAHLSLPEDETILDRIVAVQEVMGRRQGAPDGEEQAEPVAWRGGMDHKQEQLTEQLLDVIEKAQLSAMRALSDQQLQALATEPLPKTAVATAATSPFGGFPGLNGGLGAGGGGIGDLLGAIGGGSGAARGGKLPSMESVTAMLPMLGSLAGLSPETIESGKEVLSAVTHVCGVIFRALKRLAPYKDLLLAAAAALFIFVSTR